MNPRWDKFLFQDALHELKSRQGKVIVEIGAIRDGRQIAARADGHSTVVWNAAGMEVYTIDNSEEAIGITRRLLHGSSSVHLHCGDGIEFLMTFPKQIDLLYLDGPDADKGGQEFHLKAYQAIRHRKPGLILIDDCDLMPKRWRGRGKGELLIPFAIQDNYRVIQDNGRQVLLQC